MSFDLNILCINQKHVKNSLPKNIKIFAEIQNSKPNDYPKYYGDYCPFMNSVNGMWYYLKSDLDNMSSFELCDINDEAHCGGSIEELYPFWHREHDDIDVSIFKLRDEYRDDVLNTIKHFINASPIKTIIFHSRYQTFEVEPEYIYGSMAYDRFLELLDSNRILFNTCYIIRDTSI